MSGRLGNQFFRYAYTRAIQHARGNKDCLVFNFNLVYGKDPNDRTFEDVLKYFNVKPYKTSSKNLILKYGNLKQIISFIKYEINVNVIGRILGNNKNKRKSSYVSLRKNDLMFATEDESSMVFHLPMSRNVFINGNFENSQYFESIRNILIEEFQPKKPLREDNENLYNIICNTNSVCITIRRGDYLSSRYKDSFYICDENYFKRGIDVIKEKIDKPTFIFFSDDIEWVKDNIVIDTPCYYETGNDPIWEKIRLMSACKHFIISNSTFSWWAQYLSTNPNKIVVSPSRWYNAELKSMLIEESFIKIEV